MSRFTVVWSRDAIDQLAELWLLHEDQRAAITHASNWIDGELASSPQHKGEPLHEGMRKMLVPPLRVLFCVSEPDLIVQVVFVRRAMQPERNGDT